MPILALPNLICDSSGCALITEPFLRKLRVQRSYMTFLSMNMLLVVFWLGCWIFPYLYAATVLSPLWTVSSGQGHPPSLSLNAQRHPICVNAAQSPDWAGAIDARDCGEAIGRLWDRVLPYGHTQWTFWASSIR